MDGDTNQTKSRTALFRPALVELFARYQLAPASLEIFLERRQHLAESVDEYAACLRVLAKKAYPKASKEVRDEHILGRFTMGISDPKTKEDFLLNMPTSLQAALLRARKLQACRESLRQLSNETIAAIQPAVFKPQPSHAPSVSYPGPQPYCCCCRKFGSRANTVDTTQLCSTPAYSGKRKGHANSGSGGGQREYRAVYYPAPIPLCRRGSGRNSKDVLSTGPPNSH
ncbi:hypothetical protein FGIG_06671 [Fasciola gigantica]|uniref:Retrotransposon gag domain-containing protein n=1 Tax=Fasciola gigantica TaxID=46835 RepID=A0A504YYH9_FASGI|nr:hypothetical protein FGIG_06671 [Fasciola gigantica]